MGFFRKARMNVCAKVAGVNFRLRLTAFASALTVSASTHQTTSLRYLIALNRATRLPPASFFHWSMMNYGGSQTATSRRETRANFAGHYPGTRSLCPNGWSEQAECLFLPQPLLSCRRASDATYFGRCCTTKTGYQTGWRLGKRSYRRRPSALRAAC